MGDEVHQEPFPSAFKPKVSIESKVAQQLRTVAADDEEVEEEEEEADDDESYRKAIASTVFKSKDGAMLKRKDHNVGLPPLFDEDVHEVTISRQLRQFVDATECVKGGRGWWKHEFCYQQHIYHLHYETNPQTKQSYVQKRIVLGMWSKDEHIKWTKGQPKEAYRNLDAKKSTVTLYYGQGDICHENNDYRHTLVKLRCSPSTKSTASISVSLTEPKLCSYIMTVDSGMFCDLLKHVDEYGIPIRGQ